MAQQLVTFSDIVSAIREELGIQSNDTATILKIKRAVNFSYLNEIVPIKRWRWLEGSHAVVHKAFYSNSTCSVTPNSATVTLATAPAASLGSLLNYKFSINGFDEIYTISAHTAESVTITLSSTYQGALASTASYKIWRDVVDLPTDCRETTEIYHGRGSKTMEGIGSQEFRRIAAEFPKAEGFPSYYYTQDYFDPTPLTDETEADRYRQLRIYPSLNNQNATIYIDYVKEIGALSDDDDEPALPLEDRGVIVYCALSRLWASISRNPEEAARNDGLYQRKIASMMGRGEDSFDTPKLAPNARYMNRQRRNRIGKGWASDFRGSGGSSMGNITFLEDVTINRANITGNVTVAAAITIDGRDISVDGAVLDSIATLTDGIATANRVVITDTSANLDESVVTSTELLYLDDVEGLTSFAMLDNQAAAVTIASWAVASFTAIQVQYSVIRGTALETGFVNLVSDGTSASIAQGGLASLGTVGVTLVAAYSAGSLLLRYTSTSTGTAPAMKYKVQKWLA